MKSHILLLSWVRERRETMWDRETIWDRSNCVFQMPPSVRRLKITRKLKVFDSWNVFMRRWEKTSWGKTAPFVVLRLNEMQKWYNGKKERREKERGGKAGSKVLWGETRSQMWSERMAGKAVVSFYSSVRMCVICLQCKEAEVFFIQVDE